jgi:hypothetical protein
MLTIVIIWNLNDCVVCILSDQLCLYYCTTSDIHVAHVKTYAYAAAESVGDRCITRAAVTQFRFTATASVYVYKGASERQVPPAVKYCRV